MRSYRQVVVSCDSTLANGSSDMKDNFAMQKIAEALGEKLTTGMEFMLAQDLDTVFIQFTKYVAIFRGARHGMSEAALGS